MSLHEPRRGYPVVVIAPDSFKGSLEAIDVATAIASGFHDVVGPEATLLERPMADGGEGTLDALLRSWGVSPQDVKTVDALGRPTTARYGLSPDGTTGVVELAEASGLPGVADTKLDPLAAHTRGTGEVARAVLDSGVDQVLLCIGGSASTDGGTGILTGLGAIFRDGNGHVLDPSGGALASIASVDLSGLHRRAHDVRWRIAVDVSNPLTGPNGAATVYGPQKGAGSDDVQLLDDGLASLARLLQPDSHADLVTTPGMGAAGGVPLSMLALLDAETTPGAALVAEAVGLPALLTDADIVITGEGRLDAQSISGKVVGTLAALSCEATTTMRRPVVVAIAGSVDLPTRQLREAGVDAAFSIANGAATMTDLVRDSGTLVRRTAAAVAGLLSSKSTVTSHDEQP